MNKQEVLNNIALIIDAINNHPESDTLTFSIGSTITGQRNYYVYKSTDMVFCGKSCVDVAEIIDHNIMVANERKKLEQEFKQRLSMLQSKSI